MAVDLKQVHRRLIEEVFGKGNFELFEELCDPTYRSHDPVTGDADRTQEEENCRMYKTAFPDLSPTILNSVIEGDTVVTHWRMTGTHQQPLMGIPPSGKRCIVEGVTIARFRGGKLMEDWVQWDALGLLRQLGAAPEMRPSVTGRPAARPHA